MNKLNAMNSHLEPLTEARPQSLPQNPVQQEHTLR